MILLIKFLIVPFQLGNSENCHRSFSISGPFSRIKQFPGSNRILIEEKDICRRAKYRFCFHESSKWFFLLNFSVIFHSVVNSENCHRNVLDFCAHFHKRINFSAFKFNQREGYLQKSEILILFLSESALTRRKWLSYRGVSEYSKRSSGTRCRRFFRI